MAISMVCAALVLFAVGQDADPKVGKRIVWQDDFRGKGLPDPAKWGYEYGFVRNNEAQRYARSRVENARVGGGELIIEAKHEDFEGGKYSSAALESTKAWDHGYFEVVAKIPTGKGTWPAIWFLGDGIRKKGAAYIGWPLCGEIDLMENVGYDPDKVHFNIHTQSNSKAAGSVASNHVEVPNVWEGWHTYGLDYQAHKLVMYFDGKEVLTYLDDGKGEGGWPFDKPQFLILNLAIGGDWGGQHGIDDSIFPAKLEVKSVRVYQ
jgi:beta-glucanase (GH16 family)